MQPVKPKWMGSGLVLVCERCFKERIPEEDPGKAAEIGDFNLRDWLKKRLKEDGHWGKVRAVSTSCQDVCARRLVTVTIDPQIRGESTQSFVVDPIADRDALYETIVAALANKPTMPDVPSSVEERRDTFERYEDERKDGRAG